MPRKPAAIAIYLACRSTSIPRETLKALFWPESGETQSAASLRQALTTLRKALDKGADVLVSDNQCVALDTARIESDLDMLRIAASAIDTEEKAQVIKLYRGEFMEGFGALTPEFDRWLDAERGAIRMEYLQAMQGLADAYWSERRISDALHTLQEMIRVDPLQELVHRRIMEAHLAQNRSELAVRQFQAMKQVLATELGVEPDAESQDLFRKARAVRMRGLSVGASGATPPVPAGKADYVRAEQDGTRRPLIHVADFEGAGNGTELLCEALRDGLMTVFARQSGVETSASLADADFVIDGRITRLSDATVRIRSTLTAAAEHRLVWSEQTDVSGKSLPDIVDPFITRISGAVRIRLPDLLAHSVLGLPIEKMSVDELLNFAMHCNFAATSGKWTEAERALRRTLDLDPESWMAQTMLCFNLIGRSRIFGWRPAAEEERGEGRSLIDAARRRAPRSEVVRYVHGAFLLYVMGDPDGALLEAQTAFELNPDYYHTIDLLSQANLFAGNGSAARTWLERLLACDPSYPYRHLYHRSAGAVLLAEGDNEGALQHFRKADFAAPDLPQNKLGVALCADLTGDRELSDAVIEELGRLEPGFSPRDCARWPFRWLPEWERFMERLDGQKPV